MICSKECLAINRAIQKFNNRYNLYQNFITNNSDELKNIFKSIKVSNLENPPEETKVLKYIYCGKCKVILRAYYVSEYFDTNNNSSKLMSRWMDSNVWMIGDISLEPTELNRIKGIPVCNKCFDEFDKKKS